MGISSPNNWAKIRFEYEGVEELGGSSVLDDSTFLVFSDDLENLKFFDSF